MATTLRQRHAEQTRRALLAAAAGVFARHGYRDATIDQVAAEAGASKGAVYHHFASKQVLFRALLADRTAGLDALRALPDTATSLAEMITTLIDLWFVRMREHPDAIMLSLESRLQALRDPSAADLLGSYYRELRRVLGDVIGRGAERFGAPPPHPHAGLIAFSLLDGAGQQWALDPDPPELDSLRDILAGTLADLIGPQRA